MRGYCVGFCNERILVMRQFDMKVAVFPSQFMGGDVELWYSTRNQRYELKYDVQFCGLTGFCNALAVCTYDAVDYTQVASMLLDAIDIARTPLLDRS